MLRVDTPSTWAAHWQLFSLGAVYAGVVIALGVVLQTSKSPDHCIMHILQIVALSPTFTIQTTTDSSDPDFTRACACHDQAA